MIAEASTMIDKGAATSWRIEDIDEYRQSRRTWRTTDPDEERAERVLAAEMRPLIESLQRLRDRDILD